MISDVRQNAAKVRIFAEIDKFTKTEKGRNRMIPAFL